MSAFEITLRIENGLATRKKISDDPRTFGIRLRDLLTGCRNDGDLYSLAAEFGVHAIKSIEIFDGPLSPLTKEE